MWSEKLHVGVPYCKILKGKKTMKIEDIFLEDQGEFDKLQQFMMGPIFPWFYNDNIDSHDDVDKFQFIHIFLQKYMPNQFMNLLGPIIELINPVSIWRIKANLLNRTPNIVENIFHVDMGDISEEKLKQWTTSIFYVNTNNGYTEFEDGTKVESVANRMVTFPANMKHRGTSCTDEKRRVVINFNYYTL